MRCRSLIISALTAVLVSLVLPATAKANPTCPPAGSGTPAKADSIPLDVPAPYAPGLLGPATLPTGPVGKLLGGYNRFGVPPMAPKAYLDKFYKNDSWDFPTNYGFDPAQPPKQVTMKAGHLVDRFGSTYGSFLAVEKGTPFAARGLPPQSLNTTSGNPEANYHVYCILKDLNGVMYGKIAPAVGQPGGGNQYVLGNARIKDLIDSNQLVEVAP